MKWLREARFLNVRGMCAGLGQEVVQAFQLLPSHPSFFFLSKSLLQLLYIDMIIVINVHLNNGDPF